MKYRELLNNGSKNTQINEAVIGINDHGIGHLITYTLHMVSQIHIWHLLCPSGQKHTALGDLYNALNDEVDVLAERFIAQGGSLEAINASLIPFYDESTVRMQLDVYRSMVTACMTDRLDMASINDAVIDLQEIIDSNLYKFNLS